MNAASAAGPSNPHGRRASTRGWVIQNVTMAPLPVDETERKYVVRPGTTLPDLADLAAVETVRTGAEEELVATYFDTVELRLTRERTTVRRRVGGDDEGWHLKRPRGGDVREETRLPLGRAVRTVPKPLREAVEALSDGNPLTPVARVTTRRTEHHLVDGDDHDVAVVCDDEVRAERVVEPRLVQVWREWEIELTDRAAPELLDAIEARLLEAGAVPARVSSKVARALAHESPASLVAPTASDVDDGSTSAEVLGAYVAAHLAVLREHDAGLRGETVHRLRIAARRLRSALTTFRPVLERHSVDDLRDELRWLGRELSPARDAEVLRDHLDELAAGESGAGSRTLRQRIRDDLAAEHAEGLERAVAAVDSERYRWLLRSLEAVIESPSLRPKGSRPATQVLPRLLERDARRLRRAARVVDEEPAGPARGRALHEVRKKAKRLRYAAEASGPVLGPRAAKLARRTKKVQQALGAHQDTVESRAWLQRLAARSQGRPEVAFGAGRLHAREEGRAAEAERAYAAAAGRVPTRVGDWVSS